MFRQISNADYICHDIYKLDWEKNHHVKSIQSGVVRNHENMLVMLLPIRVMKYKVGTRHSYCFRGVLKKDTTVYFNFIQLGDQLIFPVI
jgi:hypothetical protein